MSDLRQIPKDLYPRATSLTIFDKRTQKDLGSKGCLELECVGFIPTDRYVVHIIVSDENPTWRSLVEAVKMAARGLEGGEEDKVIKLD